jgi:selenide, water dikinase
VKRLLLIGGGHSHVEVVRRFGLEPEPGTELVLVSPQPQTGYSGMLPGLIAGHYAAADAHIDLVRLARGAGCRFVQAAVNGMHLDARLAFCSDGRAIGYDLASIDIGSRPGTLDVPGAAAHALGVKPLERFMERWNLLLEQARAGTLPAGFRIAVVGGGAAGVETLLSMQHCLAATRTDAAFSLFSATADILPTHPQAVRRIFRRVLRERGVELHAGSAVAEVDPHSLVTEGGERTAVDLVVWATGASAPLWPRACGLAVDDGGFIRVDPALQSVNRPGLFASGDVASLDGHARPKSGVFAVRQGPLLADNLRRALRGQSPRARVPRRQALALISTGDRHAVASRGWLTAEGGWVWQWKDWVDRRFMRRYRGPDNAAGGDMQHGCG